MDWDDLVLYRKRITNGRPGAHMLRFSRAGQPKPKRGIVAVIKPDGTLMKPNDYALFPFCDCCGQVNRNDWYNRSTGVLYFREPVFTGRMTVLFH